LKRWEINLDIKKIRKIAKKMAMTALEWRDAFVNRLTAVNPFTPPDDLTDKVVQVCADGGRIRTRITKRGRKRKNGRHGFKGDWTEPLLFTITVLDSNSRQLITYKPFYDGTIEGVDHMFTILESYLSWLGIEKAACVQFAADGDKKLWSRFRAMANRLGIPRERVFEIIDYPHAVQHLWQVMDLKPSLSREEKERWIAEMKALLFQDKVDDVIDWIELLARGKNASKIRQKADYFKRYCDQMAYSTQKRDGLPIGSGVVESAIRRIVNLRLKSVGSFWNRDSLEGYLMLRSYLMADRWDGLVRCLFEYIGMC
jgi:hypothetical protein